MANVIRNWRYDDGYRGDIYGYLPGSNRTFDEDIQGWHCHVKDATNEFEEWMSKNIKGKYDCTFRFNSGDPIYTVWIKDDQDATLFKLRWMLED